MALSFVFHFLIKDIFHDEKYDIIMKKKIIKFSKDLPLIGLRR